jgi:hypothetical protein
MDTKVIPLRELQTDPEGYLRRVSDSGEGLVVELPDNRFVSIEPLDPEDNLIEDLLEHNSAFQQLLKKSAASPRKPFQPIQTTQPAPTGQNGEEKEGDGDS